MSPAKLFAAHFLRLALLFARWQGSGERYYFFTDTAGGTLLGPFGHLSVLSRVGSDNILTKIANVSNSTILTNKQKRV